MICISITLVITRHNVQEDPILLVGSEIGKAAPDSGEHASGMKREIDQVYYVAAFMSDAI